MRYPIKTVSTFACTLIGIALCVFNVTGYDPHNLFLMMFSVPMWFVELFTDLHRVNIWIMYVLTILSWAAIGFLIDLGVSRIRTWRHL
jgi:hypothetical protein